ncbi:MAG: hypothetical protein GX227_01745 [Clostridiaceae bacterium]|nr:hypothetical protein [Clostridiaceae bacterium]
MDKKTFKNKSGTSKKKLIKTRRDITRTRIIATIVVILVFAAVYYFIDSGSYVATVDGHRISKSDYQFFLKQQLASTEANEGLTTDEEKREFWTTPADGQDPFKAAKSKALDFSKEFTIQYIKAKEAGFKIDSEIKNQVAAIINSLKGQVTEKQFREQYNISSRELQSLYEKFSIIEKFKNKYLTDEYTAKDFTEDEVKAEYDKDAKVYDKVDISYVTLYRFNDMGMPLSEEEAAAKKKTAEEALDKAKQGEEFDKVIVKYTEEEASNEDKPIGKAKISYSQNSIYEYFIDWDLIEWAFENKTGDIDIIETDNFIYVARIDSRTTYDDVKDSVKKTLEYRDRESFYDSAIESWGLESRYNIIKNNRVYDSISYK